MFDDATDSAPLELDLHPAPAPPAPVASETPAPSYPPPRRRAERPEPSRSGPPVPWWMIALLVAAALVWGAFHLAGSWLRGVVSDSKALVEQSQSAPGAPELRKAGCDQALVLTAADVQKFGAHFGQGNVAMTDQAAVICTVRPGKTAPACDALAAAYVGAVELTGTFSLRVQRTGSREPICAGTFGPEGAAR